MGQRFCIWFSNLAINKNQLRNGENFEEIKILEFYTKCEFRFEFIGYHLSDTLYEKNA
jgi:hypothetical protein